MKRKKYIYAIFYPDGLHWSVLTSLKLARKIRDTNGGQLRRLNWGYWRDCNYSMDAPTFRVVSEKLVN